MNRLTSDSDDLSFLINHLNEKTNFDGDRIKAMHEKLKAYEKTGLEPKHIDSIIEQLLGYLDAEQLEEFELEQGRIDGPTYYKVEVDKLIRQAKQNGLEVGYEINSSDNKITNAKVLFMNDVGEIAAATVYEESEKALKEVKIE